MLGHGQGKTDKEEVLLNFLERISNENSHSVWKQLFPEFYGVWEAQSDEDEKKMIIEPDEVSAEELLNRLSVLEGFLEELRALADSGIIFKFPNLRARLFAERGFAVQLMYHGKHLLQEMKDKE
ncbi:MAG: hypothetical protein ACLFNN_03545 [Candidatus Paceibacterota bacterium]